MLINSIMTHLQHYLFMALTLSSACFVTQEFSAIHECTTNFALEAGRIEAK